jgi:hypothetical protein
VIDGGSLLARDPVWRPGADERARLEGAALAPGADEALRCEERWWRARDAGERGAWDVVTALADEGVAAAGSEREAVRLAFLHCLSGSLGEAEHVIAQAVQSGSDEHLPEAFAAWCAREGLAEAAARFRP